MTVLDNLLAQTREAKATYEAELEEVRARAGVLQQKLSLLDDVEDRVSALLDDAPKAAKPKPRAKPAKRSAPAKSNTTPRGERVPKSGERILAIMAHRDTATVDELVEVLGDITRSGVNQACQKLAAKGELEPAEPTRRGRATVYRLPGGDRDSSPASEPESEPEAPAVPPAEASVTPISEAPSAAEISDLSTSADPMREDVVDDEVLDLTPTQRRILGLLDSYNWDAPRIALNTTMALDAVQLELRKLLALHLVVELDDGTFRSDRGPRARVRRGAAA